MEITTFSMEYNSLYSLLLMFLPFFLLFITKKYYTAIKNLPPGPRPWPIIGNIHQIGTKPHVSAAIFAKKYGPLISLRLGTKLIVVASSREAATEILKTKDRLLSGRSIPDPLYQSFMNFYFVWANDCSDHWKSLRTLTRGELFSAKAIEAQSNLRNEKLTRMLDYLDTMQGKVVRIEEVVFTTLFNTMSNLLFGKDFLDLKDEDGTAHAMKTALLKIFQNAATPSVSDFFPKTRGLDLQGLRKECLKQLHKLSGFWGDIIKERRAGIASSKEKDFLDRLLENGFSDTQIDILALDLFSAGTDTVVTTIEWAMSELLRNKEIMLKLQDELKKEVNSTSIQKSDFSRMTYLNACIKETLRLHPVVPLLIPRRATETCDVMNYTIPKNSQIWINVWAISRDPQIWEDPHTFKPDRFIGSNLDFRGHDFEFTPFGAGRRMCPGLPSGVYSIQTMLSSLILRYDWVLPNNDDPKKIDMSEKFGVTLQKEKPLEVIFKHKE